MANVSVIDVTPTDWERRRVVNKGKGTKGGSDGGEKQIVAERKTLDSVLQTEETWFRGRRRAKWTRVVVRTRVSMETGLISGVA